MRYFGELIKLYAYNCSLYIFQVVVLAVEDSSLTVMHTHLLYIMIFGFHNFQYILLVYLDFNLLVLEIFMKHGFGY